MKSREEFGPFCELRGYRTGAEIGVQRGYFSRELLRGWPSCTKFLCIDPWVRQEDYDDPANVGYVEQERRYAEAQRVLSPFPQVEIIRSFSLSAANRQTEALDFVYLDGRHDELSVMADIRAWWPLVRSGGVLAGHDYVDEFEGLRFGVKRAVDRFAEALGLTVHQTEDGPPSWWVKRH